MDKFLWLLAKLVDAVFWAAIAAAVYFSGFNSFIVFIASFAILTWSVAGGFGYFLKCRESKEGSAAKEP